MSLVTLVSSSGPQISGDAGGLTDHHGPGRLADLRVRNSPDNRIFASGTAPVLSPLFVTKRTGGRRSRQGLNFSFSGNLSGLWASFRQEQSIGARGWIYLYRLQSPEAP